jgi:hypothetical protein
LPCWPVVNFIAENQSKTTLGAINRFFTLSLVGLAVVVGGMAALSLLLPSRLLRSVSVGATAMISIIVFYNVFMQAAIPIFVAVGFTTGASATSEC